MNIICYSLGQLQANCYLLIWEDECLVIDPADEANFLLTEIQRNKLRLSALLATHGHFDHIMAVGEIQLSYPNCPFYLHPKDSFLLKRVHQTSRYFLGYEQKFLSPLKITCIPAGRLSWGKWEMEVIETPGHTPGSCSFYFPKEKIIFTGDTLFANGIGRYDFSYSNKKLILQSLKKLFQLDPNIIVYPGHGNKTTLSKERKNFNLFDNRKAD